MSIYNLHVHSPNTDASLTPDALNFELVPTSRWLCRWFLLIKAATCVICNHAAH
jgi:hypothetical protein